MNPTYRPNCVFCRILAEEEEAEVKRYGAWTRTIVPLNPVAPGHVIVIPYAHVNSASSDAHITAETFGEAAVYVQTNGVGPHNLIASTGPEATQSVFHLHVHVIPRADGDGLALPWTGQKGQS